MKKGLILEANSNLLLYQTNACLMVRLMRFELTRHKHYRLKIARLPFRHSRNYWYITIFNNKNQYFLHTFIATSTMTMKTKRLDSSLLKSQAKSAKNGGDKEARTPDLLNAIQALSQLSYAPIKKGFYSFFPLILYMKNLFLPNETTRKKL
jgi:hypothetical protein